LVHATLTTLAVHARSASHTDLSTNITGGFRSRTVGVKDTLYANALSSSTSSLSSGSTVRVKDASSRTTGSGSYTSVRVVVANSSEGIHSSPGKTTVGGVSVRTLSTIITITFDAAALVNSAIRSAGVRAITITGTIVHADTNLGVAIRLVGDKVGRRRTIVHTTLVVVGTRVARTIGLTVGGRGRARGATSLVVVTIARSTETSLSVTGWLVNSVTTVQQTARG